MEDNRKLKILMLRIVEDMNKRGRWMDDTVNQLVNTALQELNSLAQDCRRWQAAHYETSSGHQRVLEVWFTKEKEERCRLLHH